MSKNVLCSLRSLFFVNWNILQSKISPLVRSIFVRVSAACSFSLQNIMILNLAMFSFQNPPTSRVAPPSFRLLASPRNTLFKNSIFYPKSHLSFEFSCQNLDFDPLRDYGKINFYQFWPISWDFKFKYFSNRVDFSDRNSLFGTVWWSIVKVHAMMRLKTI